MKLTLKSVTVTVDDLAVDVDPEDLSDDALMQCVHIAQDRGLMTASAGDLRITLERVYSSLIRGDHVMAMAQLAPAMHAESSSRVIKQVLYEKKLAASANGHAAPHREAQK
jgi:hypothetical protein